jgi:hypothetical protein
VGGHRTKRLLNRKNNILKIIEAYKRDHYKDVHYAEPEIEVEIRQPEKDAWIRIMGYGTEKVVKEIPRISKRNFYQKYKSRIVEVKTPKTPHSFFREPEKDFTPRILKK